MQVQRDQIVLQDVRLHVGEHALNVVRVHGSGEVIVDGRVAVALHAQEHAQDELLHVADVLRVALELRIVGGDVALGGVDLRLQQVGLVQEQDDGDAGERGIVDDRVENVLGLLQAIGGAARGAKNFVSDDILGLRSGRCAVLTGLRPTPDQTRTWTPETVWN